MGDGRTAEFTAAAGPWYVKDEGGRLVGGFRVLPKHLNPIGVCHGGMLATFCDVMMPMSLGYQERMDTGLLPTVSLSLDYLAPTPGGAWAEARVELLRRGKRLAFAEVRVVADGVLTVRANGVFSVPSTTNGVATSRLLRQLLATGG